MLVERIAAAVRHAIFGQDYRQILFRHRDVAAVVAMDDRNRRAPITLARNAPVAQAVGDFLLAQAVGGEVGGDRVDGFLIAHAVVFAGIDAAAVFLVGIPLVPG